MATGFEHDKQTLPWNHERAGSGGSHGEQQKEMHHKDTHPTARRDTSVASQHTAKCRERFELLINPSVSEAIPIVSSAATSHQPASGLVSTKQQCAAQPSTEQSARSGAGTKRSAEADLVRLSAKRAHTPPPALSQILPQPDVEMSPNALCEQRVDKPDMEAFFGSSGEF